MKSTRSKILLILLFCLAFLGQVMASTVMTYSMASMQLMDSAQISSMPIMANCHQMKKAVDATTESCCSENCHCFSSSCINFFVLLPQTNEHITFVNQALKISFSHSFIQSNSPVSLYKPPIVS